MPTRSDLRRQAYQVPNPFEDETPRIHEYTAKEIATLQSRLDKQLGPEYISTRKGPGGQNVHYLGAEKIINLANEVFGFNGWSTSIRDTTIDYVDIEKDGRVSMGLSIIMRVTLRDWTYHEDIGYGTISNCSGKGAAFEKTKKEAATDAMKRALRNFGNVLGNCVYDKEYLKRVIKVKPPPAKWNVEDLHRHPDIVQQKSPSAETHVERAASLPPIRTASEESKESVATTDYDDEFGGNAFDDVDFTRSDEFTVHDTSALEVEVIEAPQNAMKQETNSLSARQLPQRTHSLPQARPQSSTGQRPPVHPPQARPPMHQRPPAPPNVPGATGSAQQGRMAPPQQSIEQNAILKLQAPQAQQRGTSSTPENMQQRTPLQPQNNIISAGQQVSGTPIGFVRGRVAEMVQGANAHLPANAAFNLYSESPSIRKTNGINHRMSAPIRKDEVGVPLPPAPPVQSPGPNNAQAHMNSNASGVLPQSVSNNNLPPLSRPNYINPQQDPYRRIGAPPQAGMQSPGPRSGSYRSPGPAGVKRGPPDAISRQPLSDVSNVNKVSPGEAGGAGMDAKRMRVHGQEGSSGPIVA